MRDQRREESTEKREERVKSGKSSLVSVFLVLLCAPVSSQDFTGDELLKPPDGVKAAVAKVAPAVDLLMFKDLPVEKQTLWSSWGDGIVASNGRYYAAIGDHRGKDATARVYEIDGKSMRMIVDVAKVIEQKPGAYGHGKIHAALHEYDGALWFSTYWGKPREIDWSGEYQGSILLRYDLKTEKVENLGVIAPKRGLPASTFDAERGLIYWHAVTAAEDAGADELLVYDVKARKVIFQGGGEILDGKRAFLRDLKGRVWLSTKEGGLAFFDPSTNKLERTDVKLPENDGGKRGADVRAAARPLKSGVILGMTAAGRLFSFDPEKREVKDLGPNFGDGDYTAVMALSPDEKFVYFVPGAHGSSSKSGTPVVQFDVASGARKVIAFLNEAVRRRLKYNLGGTYNLQIDASGGRLFITFNGAPLADAKKVEAFGAPCVVVVTIPKEER